MAEMTEQEIQEMIQKAREGDAEANFRMSEWALQQAMEEPEEERWNTLAAKCLFKSAEAGYEPAKERMDELIRQLEEEKAAAAPANEPSGAEDTAPLDFEEETAAEDESSEEEAKRLPSVDLRKIAAGASAALGKAGSFFQGLFRKITAARQNKSAASASDQEAAPARSGRAAHAKSFTSFFRFSEWDDDRWKKAQRICLIVIIVLVILVAILLLSGRDPKEPEPEPTPEITATATPAPAKPTPTPEPEKYPDETIRAAIGAASLEEKPTDAEYVEKATTATVKTNGGVLHVRRGPSTSFDRITSIPNGTSVEVYALKNNWALVVYEDQYGWCSTQYLTMN